eukprot:evm.model.scf_30EXC.3 EVM.evm.TU.scf_30EXC.3   scf_30EXC:38583-51350(-)
MAPQCQQGRLAMEPAWGGGSRFPKGKCNPCSHQWNGHGLQPQEGPVLGTRPWDMYPTSLKPIGNHEDLGPLQSVRATGPLPVEGFCNPHDAAHLPRTDFCHLKDAMDRNRSSALAELQGIMEEIERLKSGDLGDVQTKTTDGRSYDCPKFARPDECDGQLPQHGQDGKPDCGMMYKAPLCDAICLDDCKGTKAPNFDTDNLSKCICPHEGQPATALGPKVPRGDMVSAVRSLTARVLGDIRKGDYLQQRMWKVCDGKPPPGAMVNSDKEGDNRAYTIPIEGLPEEGGQVQKGCTTEQHAQGLQQTQKEGRQSRQYSGLHRSLMEAAQRQEHLKQELEDAKAVEGPESQAAGTLARVADVCKELKNTKARAETWERAFHKVVSKLWGARKVITEAQQLQKAYAQLKAENTSLASRLEQSCHPSESLAQRHELEKAKAKIEEQDGQLQDNAGSMAALAEKLAIQEGKLATMEQSNIDLQQKLREMARWAEHLQQQNRELMKESAESKFKEMEAMRESIRADKEENEKLLKRAGELEKALLEADKRERELRADQNDLVEIQHNQGQVLNETTRQLDEAMSTICHQKSELARKEQELEELHKKLLVAKDHFERGEQLEEERRQLKGKVAALQLQLDSSASGSPGDKEEIQRLQRIIQEKDAQLRQNETDGRLDSSRCASCSHLCEELRQLRQRHRDVCDEKTQQEEEMREVKLQLSKMTPYGTSPLGRIRELELQFTQKKQEACEVQRKLQAVEAERDALLEDLVAKEDQLLQQDGRLTMLGQALKQAENQIERSKRSGPQDPDIDPGE